MRLEWLRSYIEAVEQKSMSKASEKCHLSQPALSKQIKKLEESLGVQLLKRTSMGVELTERGAFFYKRILPVLAELEAIFTELQVDHTGTHFTVGTLSSIAAYYLPTRVISLQKSGIRIVLQTEYTSKDVFTKLIAGKIDAALIQLTATQLTQVDWKAPLFSEPYCAILPAAHSLSLQQTVTLKEIRKEPLIVYPRGCETREVIESAYHQYGWTPNIYLELDYDESILGFVSAGAGISLVPRLVGDHTGHLSVKVLPITDFPVERTVWLVARSPKIGQSLLNTFSPSQKPHKDRL